MSKRNPRQEVINLRRKRYLLAFLVLIIVCVSIWIFVSIFSSQQKSTIPPEVSQEVEPLVPELDTQVLESLEQKPLFTDAELAAFPIYIVKTDRFTRTQSIVPLEE